MDEWMPQDFFCIFCLSWIEFTTFIDIVKPSSVFIYVYYHYYNASISLKLRNYAVAIR